MRTLVNRAQAAARSTSAPTAHAVVNLYLTASNIRNQEMKVIPFALLIFLVVAASAQLTIDANSPVTGRRREPTQGSGGGIGRKLPVRLAIEAHGSPPDDMGRTQIEFAVTNSAKTSLEIPISRNPGDFEPEDPNAVYTVKEFSLYMTSDTGSGNDRHELMLAGGANLYGDRALPGSLAVLAPGKTIHVLTWVSLPKKSRAAEGNATVVAHVALNEETIRTVGSLTSSNTQEIGSASSEDYKLSSLLLDE
jgi:hypothetical protein